MLRRIKVFVDFWNVVINARQQSKKFDVEVRWDVLVDLILQESIQGYSGTTNGDLAGCYIFGSYNRSDPRSKSFVEKTLDHYGICNGIFFDFKELIKKETSAKCPKCDVLVPQNSESGIDVLLTIEMIKHASMREHEYLALVSSDRDYIPLLSYLRDQGHRVIHIATNEPHREMRSLTWAQIELKAMYPHVCSISPENCLIITAPAFTAKIAEAKSILDEENLNYEVVDISSKEDISDKDLRFLIANQTLLLKKGRSDRVSFSVRDHHETLSDFRKGVRSGSIACNLPYVIRNGAMDAYWDGAFNWTVGCNSPATLLWSRLNDKNLALYIKSSLDFAATTT